MTQTGAKDSQAEPEGLLQSAIEHHQAGRLAEAEVLYRQVLGLDHRHAEALSLMGVLAAQVGDLARGRELVKAAIAEQPEHAGYRFNLAHILHMSGDRAAVHAYRETLKLDPVHLPALVNLGNLMLTFDRLEDAGDCFEQARQANPRSVEAHEGLGIALQKQHRIAEAINVFEQALALDPSNTRAHGNLGSLLLEAGRVEEAIVRIRQSLAGMGPRAELHTNLGTALCAAGKVRESLAEFDAALAVDPTYCRALGLKGLALTELGERDAAAAIFNYDRLLASTRPKSIPGYQSLAEFNAALADVVLEHPGLMSDRPTKTTRAGSQTGELLNQGSVPIAALEQIIRSATWRYFDLMKSAGDKPFPMPLPTDWRLTLWGTVLRSGGYQDAHNHTGRILSGVYYVQLPSVLEEEAGSDQGAIEFGSLPDQLPFSTSPVLRRVKPEEGLLLLFPSHFWHRTIPCFGDEPRISIAFDILV